MTFNNNRHYLIKFFYRGDREILALQYCIYCKAIPMLLLETLQMIYRSKVTCFHIDLITQFLVVECLLSWQDIKFNRSLCDSQIK